MSSNPGLLSCVWHFGRVQHRPKGMFEVLDAKYLMSLHLDIIPQVIIFFGDNFDDCVYLSEFDENDVPDEEILVLFEDISIMRCSNEVYYLYFIFLEPLDTQI